MGKFDAPAVSQRNSHGRLDARRKDDQPRPTGSELRYLGNTNLKALAPDEQRRVIRIVVSKAPRRQRPAVLAHELLGLIGDRRRRQNVPGLGHVQLIRLSNTSRLAEETQPNQFLRNILERIAAIGIRPCSIAKRANRQVAAIPNARHRARQVRRCGVVGLAVNLHLDRAPGRNVDLCHLTVSAFDADDSRRASLVSDTTCNDERGDQDDVKAE
jgi:hypothetical protein